MSCSAEQHKCLHRCFMEMYYLSCLQVTKVALKVLWQLTLWLRNSSSLLFTQVIPTEQASRLYIPIAMWPYRVAQNGAKQLKQNILRHVTLDGECPVQTFLRPCETASVHCTLVSTLIKPSHFSNELRENFISITAAWCISGLDPTRSQGGVSPIHWKVERSVYLARLGT